MSLRTVRQTKAGGAGAWIAVALFALLALPAAAAPPIRTSPDNVVPACVTPERLTAFLATRNASPEPRFRAIADLYRRHGSTWRVRWDYAFFQMALETNFLQFRRGNGTPGDVRPAQNNFAGLGTTGGGVPGDSYPDVATGVLAQIQHLVVYSGERIAAPVGARTRLKQDDIISATRAIATRRPVTFQDLSRRWAADRAYGRSIDTLARLFAERFCAGRDITVAWKTEPVRVAAVPGPATRPPPPTRATRPAAPPPPSARTAGRAPPLPVAAPPRAVDLARVPAALAALRDGSPQLPAVLQPPVPVLTASPAGAAAPSPACAVREASYGGTRALLIRRERAGRTEITALGVHDGFESAMAESFIRSHAPGGVALGRFPSRDAALEQAHALCAAARPAG